MYTNHLVHGVCTNKPNNNEDKLKEREEDKDKLKGLVGISLSLSLYVNEGICIIDIFSLFISCYFAWKHSENWGKIILNILNT